MANIQSSWASKKGLLEQSVYVHKKYTGHKNNYYK